MPTRCHSRFERALRRQGYRYVAGLDEAGRGCLCGPVYAAAVILSNHCDQLPLRDSKQLTPAARRELAAEIQQRAEAWAVACSTVEEIERLNILQASKLAMLRALALLDPQPDFLLIDALSLPVPIPQRAVIKGDARCRSIAAASILAKVARDEAMLELDRYYPQYGLARNKGYATTSHLEALRRYGPCPEHRRTFEPLRSMLSQLPLFSAGR